VFRESIVAEEEGEAEGGEEIISLELAEVSQCVLPGNNRNEIEIQFHESDTVEQGTDQLVQIRFYVPPDPEADPTDKDSQTAAELMQHAIVTKASIRSSAAGNVIAKFDETQGTFLTPRGRYTIELFYKHLRLRGNKYDYKIKYDDISKLFLLPKPDDYHMAFIIALEKPIRQGQQRYQYLIMQTNKNQSELEILLDEGTLQNEYGGELQPLMQGSLSNLIAKTFKVVTKKKVRVTTTNNVNNYIPYFG
jgi:structure-specific recognition protein 1